MCQSSISFSNKGTNLGPIYESHYTSLTQSVCVCIIVCVMFEAGQGRAIEFGWLTIFSFTPVAFRSWQKLFSKASDNFFSLDGMLKSL